MSKSQRDHTAKGSASLDLEDKESVTTAGDRLCFFARTSVIVEEVILL